jgi:hypothetical protein
VVNPQASPPAVLGGPTEAPKLLCHGCGKAIHGFKNRDYQKACRAVNITCIRCKKVGHFAAYCREIIVASIEEETAEIHQIEGSFFYMEEEGHQKPLKSQPRDSRKGSGKQHRRRKKTTPVQKNDAAVQVSIAVGTDGNQPEDIQRTDRSITSRSSEQNYWSRPSSGCAGTPPQMRSKTTAHLDKDDRSATSPRPERWKTMRKWIGWGRKQTPSSTPPGLLEAELRFEPGTPGALGGGPVQPPGGPGGAHELAYGGYHDYYEGTQGQSEKVPEIPGFEGDSNEDYGGYF